MRVLRGQPVVTQALCLHSVTAMSTESEITEQQKNPSINWFSTSFFRINATECRDIVGFFFRNTIPKGLCWLSEMFSLQGCVCNL